MRSLQHKEGKKGMRSVPDRDEGKSAILTLTARFLSLVPVAPSDEARTMLPEYH
jgi:hypothetical protein